MSHPLFKNYPQVIDAQDVEKVLLQFEVQVAFGSNGQNVTDCPRMVPIGGLGGDSYVIHVNANRSAQQFMLSYDRAKDVVHHCLKRSR